jgi:hypothetical protein
MASTHQPAELEKTRQPVPEDDFFAHHPRSEDPFWNESSWFGFMIPERKIDAYFYVWHRPNMNLIAAGIAIWDDIGTEPHNCLYHDWFNFNPAGAETDMFQYQLRNGMSCELIEPLWEYRLRHDSPTCQVDLNWRGIDAPVNLHWGHEKEGYDVFGGFHYEQFGRVNGTITVEGETIGVDCHHIRDRSWGPRPHLPYMGRGGVELAWASERTSFCTTMGLLKSTTPIGEPSVEPPDYGQFTKDGILGRVVGGERRVVERAADGRPQRIVIVLVDEHGRDFHADGRVVNCLKWNDLWFCHWCLVDWTIEGSQAWGESQDWIDKTLLRAHQRTALRAAR